MLRHPSQPSAFSSDSGTISGFTTTTASLSAPGIVVEQRHEQPQVLVNLRRGQTDSVVLVHGVDHVVDEPLHHRILEIAGADGAGGLAQDRVAHARDFQNRHEGRL